MLKPFREKTKPKHVKITVILVGTYGQLDLPEGKFRVLDLQDQIHNIAGFIQQQDVYKDYGFTMITAIKKDI